VYVRVFLNPDSKVSFIYTYKHYKLFKLLCECDRINQNNNNYIYIKKKKKKKKLCFVLSAFTARLLGSFPVLPVPALLITK
jgi:hypothetical protein